MFTNIYSTPAGWHASVDATILGPYATRRAAVLAACGEARLRAGSTGLRYAHHAVGGGKSTAGLWPVRGEAQP
jgi:hypothetical protein